MFEKYIKIQEPKHNNDDLINLMFKQLIIESFTDNEEQFDKILKSFKEKDISLFNTFTIYPEYSGSLSNSDVEIERNDSDYGSFISACTYFIKSDKYLTKIVQQINRKEIEDDLYKQEGMTSLIFSLLDNNYKNALNTIVSNDILNENEIKLKLILPENMYYFHQRKINIYTLEVDFLSEHIHELRISPRNRHKVADIYKYTLENSNSIQYKMLMNLLTHKVDYSIFDQTEKKQIFKILLEFGIINENQIVGENLLLEEPKIEIKSFLNLGQAAIEQMKLLQGKHLEKRLRSTDSEITQKKEKLKKI